MKLWWCFACGFLSISLSAQTPPPSPSATAVQAAEPSVPPGKSEAGAKAPVQAEVTPIGKVEAKPLRQSLPNCATYSVTPLNSLFIYRDKTLYFTSPKLASDTSGASAYLIEADLSEGRAKRVAGFKAGKDVSLLAHSQRVEAVTILDFTDGQADCGEGLTSGTAIKPSEQKVSPSYPSGRYGLIPGEPIAHLAELDKGLIQVLDLGTLQKRTLASFPAGTRPLFFKASPPTALYSYNPKLKELSKFVANKKVADATLKLKDGMRIVQSGESFGIAQVKDKDLQIVQLKDWSGPEVKTKTTSLSLPAGFIADTLAVKANFASDAYLVLGKDEATRKSLRTVLLFSGKTIKSFKSPDEKSYFSAADLRSDGSLLMLLSELDTQVVRELWLVQGGAEPRKIDVLKMKKPESAKK